MIHGADIMTVKKPWHRHNASKYWPSVILWCCQTEALWADTGTLGTLHGENIGQHPVTSCDGDLLCHAVTLCNAESVTLQELVTGLGNVSWCCIPQSCRDTCYAAVLQSSPCACSGPCPSYCYGGGSPHPSEFPYFLIGWKCLKVSVHWSSFFTRSHSESFPQQGGARTLLLQEKCKSSH